MKIYKVILYGLGNVGRVALRMIMEKESLQLVGAIDIDPAKVGKDAGEIFGFGKTGVIVSDDADAVLALDADIVLVYTALTVEDGKMMPFTPTARTLCKVLNTGKNLITTMPLNYSVAYEPETFEILDKCAKENGVTYMPSGLLPGAYASYIPMVISSITSRVDKIIVQSGEDDQTNTSKWLRVFGYGTDPETFPKEQLTNLITHYYSSAVHEIAARLNIQFDEFKTEHEIYAAPCDLHPAYCEVKKGTIFAHYFDMSGYVKGEKVVSMRYVHKVCDELAPEPSIKDWIHIEGIPTLDVEIKGMIPHDEPFATSAAPTVNGIPVCVEAPPGYQQPMDLKVVVPIK